MGLWYFLKIEGLEYSTKKEGSQYFIDRRD